MAVAKKRVAAIHSISSSSPTVKGGVTETWEYLNWEIAERYTELNSPRQRHGPNTKNPKGGKRWIVKLFRDMANGNWDEDNPQNMLVFDDDGNLLDGYKRCAALAMTKDICPDLRIRFRVIRNVPPKAIETMDQGERRTFIQSLRVRGKEATPLEAAITKSILWTLESLVKGDELTGKSQLDLYEKYREAIEFSAKLYNSARFAVKSPAVRGAIARAYISIGAEEDSRLKEDLSHFMWCLDTGESKSERDRLPIKLRNEALVTKGKNTRAAREVLYAKSVQALYLFLTGGSDKRSLYPARKQHFPIPEDRS